MEAKIHLKMTANDRKSCLSYLNKFVDQYNNTYHHYIGEKPLNADYYSLTEKIEMNLKAPKVEVNDRVRIIKYKNIFSKCYTENWSREIFIIDLILKTNPWVYKIKDLNREKVIGSFYEKELLLSYYSELDSHIKDKVKVVLDFIRQRFHCFES